jgi:Mg2+ and Co2+ transporter CorA
MGIHPVTVEDILESASQSSEKIERFDRYLFIVYHERQSVCKRVTAATVATLATRMY